jgi:predicted SprT family Zn-dependent metalloprotease
VSEEYVEKFTHGEVKHVRKQRAAGQRHQHLGVTRFHPLAFASGKDDDVQRRIRHESTNVIETE